MAFLSYAALLLGNKAAVKRLMREAEELRNATEEYYAHPLEDNLFEWHFTVRGPPKTDFDGGIYHGRITLPPDYPMKPPSIILLTPNGRFETNKKICLSISGHHPESWQPSWSIRTALLAIIGFMPTHGNGAIGSLDYSPEERQALAKKSQKWCCPECGCVQKVLDRNETFDLVVKTEMERQSLYYIEKSVDEESNTQITTMTHIQPVIRPRFSFSSNVDSMLEAFQGSGPSNLTGCLSSPEQANLQNHARQRLFSQVNSQETPPVLVGPLSHGGTHPRYFLYSSICTVCIYVTLLLLCILIIRRLFFCP